MTKPVTYLLFSILTILIQKNSFSQNDSTEIYDLDFNQLSKLKITSASKTPESIKEVPSTIYVITAAEIKERGYFTLEEALSDLPGFQFRNILSFNSYVFQRGVPSQNNLILVLIDGIQVNELNSGGFYAGGQYNLSDVERIEVIYGPASVAYGTNAMSGIINIITKNSKDKRFEISSLLGNFNTENTDLTYGYTGKKKDFYVSASGMYKQSDKADLRGGAGDYNWTDLLDNFENDYALDLKIYANNFILGTNYQQKKSSTATYVKSTGTGYRDYGTLWNIRFLNNYLKYHKNISKHVMLSSVLYNSNTTVLDNSVLYVTDTGQLGYYRPNNLSGLETTVNYSSNSVFSFTGGVTLEGEWLSKYYSITNSNSPELKPPAPKKPPIESNYLISLFIEPRLTLFQDLFLSGGFRFDQSSIYDQVLTPRAGIVYNLFNQVIRFSYAEAFRAPKPWDYTDGLGNDNLLPERMKSLESAVTFSISDACKIDLVGYKNKLDEVLNKEFINDNYRWVNNGTINTDGVEIYFRYSSRKFKSSVNYTFNQSLNERKEFIPEISKHSGNVSATYFFGNYFTINLRANYEGKRENPEFITATNSSTIDPYLVFNGAFSLLNYKNFTVQLIAGNIFNTTYYHTSNRMPQRYRQPQRTVMMSVGYALNKRK